MPVSQFPNETGSSPFSFAPGEIVAAMVEAALLLGADGSVLAVNALLVDILGHDPTGQALASAIRVPAVLEAVARVRHSGGASRVPFEVRASVPRSYEVIITALGRAGTTLVLLHDLTREERVERMRADFVANASHELRTPLASIMGIVETLQGAAAQDGRAREKFLATMSSQASRMKRLIDDLLSLSRIEMNEHHRPVLAVDLSRVLHEVCDMMTPAAKTAGMEIRLDAKGPALISGERDELVQAVQNLIENALKYGADGRVVEVAVRREADGVHLDVRDFGQGIEAAHIPRLTERFYRVSAQESRMRGGTGLGLAIVKHIANRHRARLTIQSQPGQGSVFSIIFPPAISEA